MKTDIVPALKQKVIDNFEDLIRNDEVLFLFLEKADNKTASYIDADLYAQRVGELSSQSLMRNITADRLPNGKLYFNIGDRVINPALRRDYELISEYCMQIQEALNEKAQISIKAQKAPVDKDRIKGFVDRSSNENFEDIKWLFDQPLKTYCQSVVGDHILANADFHKAAGLYPKIVRTTDGHCCKWCSEMAGVYEYSATMNRDVFRKHDNCGCTVEYDPGNGSKRKQNVWTKEWLSQERDVKVIPSEKSRSDYRDYKYSSVVETKLKAGVPVYVRRVLNSENDIFVDDNIRLSKKKVQKVDSALSLARKKLGIIGTDGIPEHVIYSDKTIGMVGGPTASFLPAANMMFINAGFLDSASMRNRAKEEGYVFPDKFVATFVHEYSHWLRANQWVKETQDLTKKPSIHEFCKQILDKMDLDKEELYRISKYAQINAEKERYYEVLAEVDTKNALR